jgi:hypothetical protein
MRVVGKFLDHLPALDNEILCIFILMKRFFLTIILAAMAATAMAQEGDGQSSLTSEASISGLSSRTGESARSGEREIS